MAKHGWREIFLIGIVYISFISLGLPDGLQGVTWPSMMDFFKVPIDSLGVLLFTGTAGYLLTSFFSGRLIAVFGIGFLLAASCAVTGAALLGYAFAPDFITIAVLALIVGLAGGAIDAGLNAYAAENFSKRVMQWLHASYGLGVMLGPVIMVYFINMSNSWKSAYAASGILQILMAIIFFCTVRMWKGSRGAPDSAQDAEPIKNTIIKPSSWVNMLLFFIISGAEAGVGIWAYTFLTEARGIGHSPAAFVAGAFWAAYTFGRVIAGAFSKYIKTYRLIYLCLVGALFGTALIWAGINTAADFTGVILSGLFIGPIFPALVSGTKKRVGGHHAFNMVGMQMAASGLGYAVLPGIAGIAARHWGLETLPLFIACLLAFSAVLYRVLYYFMPGHILDKH
ncbi:MAG: putative transporter [Candidatus Aerophobetes bacterium ADurb.Bin490]|nr:MAG: putative transporter [Candidatus Aerophobetes bacterium ADurb.Bin490]